MAAELGQYIQDQLSRLPGNHPDRPLLESMLGITQAYLHEPTRPKEEFKPRPNSRTDLYLGEAGLIDLFSENARVSLYLAEEEAKSLHHNYIGTEHILLGILKEGGKGSKVLHSLGVEERKVRSAVIFIVGKGRREIPGENNFTPRSKKVFNLAADETRKIDSANVDSQDLLLALVQEGESIAAGVLESLGVTSERIHTEILRMFPPQA